MRRISPKGDTPIRKDWGKVEYKKGIWYKENMTEELPWNAGWGAEGTLKRSGEAEPEAPDAEKTTPFGEGLLEIAQNAHAEIIEPGGRYTSEDLAGAMLARIDELGEQKATGMLLGVRTANGKIKIITARLNREQLEKARGIISKEWRKSKWAGHAELERIERERSASTSLMEQALEDFSRSIDDVVVVLVKEGEILETATDREMELPGLDNRTSSTQ